MLSFTTVAKELQLYIVQYLDIPALKALRLVCRTASAIAVVQLFHTITLRFTDGSATRLKQILADDKLRPLVKKVILDGERGRQEAQEEWEEEGVTRQEFAWSLAIATIAGFPSLREIELQFDDERHSDWDRWLDDLDARIKYREDYMKLTFTALQSAKLVDSLTIFHLLDASCRCPGPQFRDGEGKIANPDRLTLMIAITWDDAAPEANLEQAAVQECFNQGLENLWLKPTQLQLTHLTLYADIYWGIYPFSDLRGLCFPKLQSLALGNFSIAHGWQIDWITSHGQTLEELILDDCPIVYALQLGDYDARDNDWEEDSIKLVEMRWSNVFPLFQQRLKRLRHFGVGHGPWANDKMVECRCDLPASIEPSRYVSYEHGQGPTPWIESDIKYGRKQIEFTDGITVLAVVEVPDCEDEDQAALDALLHAVRYGKAERGESK
ncbi:hypothetical protein CC80DRAFT_475821 [Byssothecium circinans]|uniref:F-box domain-containing protein n=1 Tax=Byssothecium circinans TaxID=147558 RepID=A0A6A5U051_9PLEO|nr:hypothetical protein CC80DRAFT_475821 [Byssothecium circinans]